MKQERGVFERIDFEKFVNDEGVLFSIGDPNGKWKVDLCRDELEELFTSLAAEFPDYGESKQIEFIRMSEMMMTRVENILALTVEELQRMVKENRKK